MSTSDLEQQLRILARKAERERRMRLETERVIDCKSLEIFSINEQLRQANTELDRKILQRTAELRRAKEAIEQTAGALADSNRRFELVMQASRAAIWEWCGEKKAHYFSPHLTTITGYSQAELGRLLQSLRVIHPGDRKRLRAHVRYQLQQREPFELEFRLKLQNGEYRWFRVNGQGEWRGDETSPVRVAGSIVDIDQQIRNAALAHKLTRYDSVTNILNRATFISSLNEYLRQAEQNAESFAVLLLDIDGFKNVNDKYGQAAGDNVLRHVAAVLTNCIKGYDVAARLGGDEFGVVLRKIQKRDDILAVCRQLLESLRQPLQLNGSRIRLGASVGIACYPHDADDADTLIGQAHLAMLCSRSQSGRTERFTFHEPRLGNAVRERRRLEDELQDALERQEFELDYQPEVALDTGELVGAEALLRWRHPQRGRLAPDAFITQAEQSGLIIPIGEWVINQVCSDLAKWQRAGARTRVAINLSPVQFIQGDVVNTLRKVMLSFDTPPECIEVEITESLLLHDVATTRELLAEMHDLGVNISLDDFGSGYSSLAYLLELPVDTVKIDRSFIRRLGDDEGSRVITRAIINLAHSLQLHVLGEGVETVAQADWLRAAGCDFAQGFHYSHPVPAASLQAYLSELVARSALPLRDRRLLIAK